MNEKGPRVEPRVCVVIQPVSSPVGFSPGSSIPGCFMNFSWRELSTPWSPSLLPQGRVSLAPHGWTNTAGPSVERRYPPPSHSLPCSLHSPCTVCVGPLLLWPMFTQRQSGCPRVGGATPSHRSVLHQQPECVFLKRKLHIFGGRGSYPSPIPYLPCSSFSSHLAHPFAQARATCHGPLPQNCLGITGNSLRAVYTSWHIACAVLSEGLWNKGRR